MTLPALYWVGLYSPPEGDHGHGHDDHDKHEEEESQDEEEPQAEAQEQSEDSRDENENKDDSDSDSGDGQQDTPDTSDDEGEKEGDSKEGNSEEKGSKEGDSKDQGSEAPKSDGKNTTVKYPDAKGGIKNRKESNAAKKQGEPGSEEETAGDKVSPLLPSYYDIFDKATFRGNLQSPLSATSLQEPCQESKKASQTQTPSTRTI